MSSMEETLTLLRRPSLLESVTRIVSAPRFVVYLCCTLAALLTSYHLGKDMAWDTLDYHFFAGFSALHDRFGQDYFPAGAQSYLNPYVFVPFYLLTTSGLTALEVALILAAIQSVILWLTYELALAVAPPAAPRTRLALAICAAALAWANPILINQFGSSFADILTAEIVVAAWLLIISAIRGPSTMRVVCAALLLGCASALKLTNGLHAVSAGALVLFIPGSWRSRLRYAALFVMAGIVGFAVIAAPWSIRLQEHFGNPFFPLLNGIFRSPQFTTARIIQYRFIPPSLGAALSRPFAIVTPRSMIQAEWATPDLRYALLLVGATAAAAVWAWKRVRGQAAPVGEAGGESSRRALAALGVAFLIDWVLWLTASGNGRYFIPMACVAAVLAVVVIFGLFARWPKARNYVLLAAFIVQFYQLRYGTQYSPGLAWGPEPWFQVSVPKSLASEPQLYFTIGTQTNSFIAPFLAPGSGLINLEGDYTLGAGGANGEHIAALIRRFSPHVRILMRDRRRDAGLDAGLPEMVTANDAMQPFGLRVDTSTCARIVVRDVSSSIIGTITRPRSLSAAEANTGYFVTCGTVAATAPDPALVAQERVVNVALGRVEDACPALFQPRRQTSYLLGDEAHGYIWVRQYTNTDMVLWVAKGWVHFQGLLSQKGYAGQVSAWEKAPLRVSCGRGADKYFLRVIGPG